jgi:hypothetical protein
VAESDEFASHPPVSQVGLSVAMRITSFPIAAAVDGRLACSLSTPSGCSSKSSDGPPRKSATLRPLTGGPGSSPATPSSASPGRSPMTCACPGNAQNHRPAHPGPGPQRISEHPRGHPLPGRCTQTRQARPRAAARVEEPPARTPLRRGENHQTRPHPHRQARTRRLNNKLSLAEVLKPVANADQVLH